MTKTSIRFHNFIISVLMSILIWAIVNQFLISIGLLQFIFIEIIIGISEVIVNFVKEKAGLNISEPPSN
jgi:hypothetical protein